MFGLKGAIDIEEYMKTLDKHHEEAYLSTTLSEEAKDTLKDLKEEIIVLAFTEGFCPDCTVSIPFVKRFKEENDKISVSVLPRTGNEAFLEENLGEARIPTIMVFSKDLAPKGVYLEFPEKLKDNIAIVTMDEKKELIKEYRAGKYNNLIEEELLNLILK